MFYLYKKNHNLTGLQYLGYTSQNPFKYLGSGKYWSRHIKIHGKSIETKILYESDNIKNIKEAGIFYSELWNVVQSKEWANLKPEEGIGGSWSGLYGKDNPMYGKKQPQYVKDICSKINKGKKNLFLSKLNKKRKWRTNGINDVFTEICPPNFKKGRSSMKGSKNSIKFRWFSDTKL